MTFEAEELIKQAIERYGEHIVVACSFGKDSIVVLHMALKYDPNIKVMFNNTGVEFPETIKYKNKIVKEWDLNIIETKPIKTFWECIDQYGVPGIRVKNKGSNVPMCCTYCKEKPAINYYKKHKTIAVMTGITAEESRQRSLLIKRYDNHIEFCGQRYYAKTQSLWKLHPLAYWTEKEVWSYIKNNNIPINPVYTKWNGLYKRCGCLPCTAYLDWEKKLSKSHKKLYLKLKSIQEPTQRRLKCT